MNNSLEKNAFSLEKLFLIFLMSFVLFFVEFHQGPEDFGFSARSAWAEPEEDPDEEIELAHSAERAILDLSAHNSWFKDHVTEAKAIFVAPALYRGMVLTGGSGLLVLRQEEGWSQKVFYRVEVPDLGFNLGRDQLEIILLIKSHMGLSSFYTGGFQLGRGLRITEGLTLVDSHINDISADIIAFTRLQSTGTYTNIPLKGVRISVSNDYNHSFYGASVEPVEIMGSLSVRDLGFSGLLSALRHPPLCPKDDKTLCNIQN